MDILLTHGYFLEEDIKEQEIMKPYPPLGILYISAFLNERGVSNKLFDSTFSSSEQWKEYVIKHQPPVIAFYCNLMTKVKILSLVEFVKSREDLKQIKLIAGGPDLRYNSENYLRAGFDFLVIGEGEETTFELVQSLRGQSKTPLSEIQGLTYLNGEREAVHTGERTKIKEVNELPLPNREGIDLQRYLDTWKKHHGQSAINISTQRGCPYTCKWCSTAVYGQSYRRRSPDQVVEEMTSLKEKYNPDTLWFVDDVFTVSHKWLKEFVEALNFANVKIPFECITRADRMNAEVIDLLKQAGCFRVWIGAESGSQKIIDAMDRRVDVHKVREMLQLSKKAGIETGTFIMVGYPGETEEDIQETISHLVESDPDIYTITVAYPIKGTSLYTEVEDKLTHIPEWTTSTDRDLEFTRTHSRRYYDLAVRRIYNEVAYQKTKAQGKTLQAMKAKTKAGLLKVAMQLNK